VSGRAGRISFGASPSANPAGERKRCESDLTFRASKPTQRGWAIALASGCLVAVLGVAGIASGQDLQSQLDAKRAELDQERDRKGVLTTEITEYSEQISQLEGEVALLRTREAQVTEELEETKAELREARERLERLRRRLDRSLEVLEERLIAIYKQDEPDALTVILQSDGFEDMLERYEYLQRIQDQDSEIVARVRGLRSEQAELVETIEIAKEQIAAKRRELVRTRAQLEARQADLQQARAARADTLAAVEQNIERLEGDVSDLQGEIQAQLQAAAQEQAAAQTAPPQELPAGPTQETSSGFIWPVNGPVTSPFGMRWGRMHEGIDIAVPSGTPISASKAGTVAIAAPTGGYGNYTCINHGGGLSTCYAHQSSFAVGVGDSVSQGQVIGSVGCTGSCFGDHLHFEVRVDGAAVDPMGYL
jgi:murein DD-endopeptidase MepM/ murein hydrolase activator NlpD